SAPRSPSPLSLHDALPISHRLFGIELRLLRQVADLDAGHRAGFALDLRVDAGHDLEQRRLAGAVEAEDADLGAGEETERDVLQDLPLGRHDLADAVHGVDVLGHPAIIPYREIPAGDGGGNRDVGVRALRALPDLRIR